MYSRAKIQVTTMTEIETLVREINSDSSSDHWVLENEDGTLRVSARSLLGMIYACTDWRGETYLVNETRGAEEPLPAFVDKYRV